MDDYFAHLEYSEVTNWGAIFDTYTPQGWYGYIKDQVGTIYKVWDLNAKALADVRTYDSFGNLISQTGTTKTPLGFQGKYYDQESGLNYFYNRYYNATLGRFISEDPIGLGGGLNVYKFVNNNSIHFIDPFGFESEPNSGVDSIVVGWCKMFAAARFGIKFKINGTTFVGYESAMLIYGFANGDLKGEWEKNEQSTIAKTTLPEPNEKDILEGGSVVSTAHTHWGDSKRSLGDKDPMVWITYPGPQYIIDKNGVYEYTRENRNGRLILDWTSFCEYCKVFGGWSKKKCCKKK